MSNIYCIFDALNRYVQMKKIILSFLLFFLLGSVFTNCSTEVDLYTDYKDITVIYGLLDIQSDTNYVRISKAFIGPGDANEIALIDDSSNYPRKLDARIIEYRASASGGNYVQTRVLPLDTMTIHNKKPGTFYSPNQLVYFTKERINRNTDAHQYMYELLVDRGDTVLSAKTGVVGGGNFRIANNLLDFKEASGTNTVSWFPSPNAEMYEVYFTFNFNEINSSGQTFERSISWKVGTYPVSSLTLVNNNKYSVSYSKNALFRELEDFFEHNNTPNIVKRTVLGTTPMTITISAGGVDLYNFITVNSPSSSIVQIIPEYTNVIGGYGVFSSRTSISTPVGIKNTLLELRKKHPDWLFEQG